jgi:hypothetical protein
MRIDNMASNKQTEPASTSWSDRREELTWKLLSRGPLIGEEARELAELTQIWESSLPDEPGFSPEEKADWRAAQELISFGKMDEKYMSLTDEEISNTEWWYRFYDTYSEGGIFIATPRMVNMIVDDENFTYTVPNVNERIRIVSANQFSRICPVSEVSYDFSFGSTMMLQWQNEQSERTYEKRKQEDLEYFTSALKHQSAIKWESDGIGAETTFNLGAITVNAFLYRCRDRKLTLQMIFREVPSIEAATEEVIRQLKQLRLDIDNLLDSK